MTALEPFTIDPINGIAYESKKDGKQEDEKPLHSGTLDPLHMMLSQLSLRGQFMVFLLP